MNSTIINGSQITFTNRSKSNINIDSVKNATLSVKSPYQRTLDIHHMGSNGIITLVNNTSTGILNIFTSIFKTSSNYTYNNTNRTLTVNSAGTYMFNIEIEFAENASGVRALLFLFNGTQIIRISTRTTSSGPVRMSLTFVRYMNAGDTVVPQAFQNSGGNLQAGNSTFGQNFYVVKL